MRIAFVRRSTASRLALAMVVLQFAACDRGAAHCAIAPPALADWRLHADGTQLRDALGRVVTLRGVDAGGRSKFAPYVPFDFSPTNFDQALAAYLDRAQSWGVDVFRLPFTWAAVEPVQGQDDAQYLARLDAIVDGAWARGIRVVLDFHQDVYAENFCGDGFPAWTIPPPAPAPHHDCPTWSSEYGSNPDVQAAFDRFWAPGSTVQAAYVALWDRLSQRYRDRPGVIGFELINEPSGGTQPARPFESTTLTSFYSTVGAHLRAGAPSTLLFFDATGVDGVLVTTAINLPSGDGWVFAPHYYQASATNAGGDGVPDQVMGDLSKWAALGAKWNVPVFVGELGVSNLSTSGADYMRAHFDALDALAIGGTEWEYSVAAEGWNGETFGMVAADGTPFPVAQAIARPYARAVSGDAITAAFDDAHATYELRYTGDGGVTELALPAKATIDVSGACVDDSHAGTLYVRGAGAIVVRVTTH